MDITSKQQPDPRTSAEVVPEEHCGGRSGRGPYARSVVPVGMYGRQRSPLAYGRLLGRPAISGRKWWHIIHHYVPPGAQIRNRPINSDDWIDEWYWALDNNILAL